MRTAMTKNFVTSNVHTVTLAKYRKTSVFPPNHNNLSVDTKKTRNPGNADLSHFLTLKKVDCCKKVSTSDINKDGSREKGSIAFTRSFLDGRFSIRV